MSNEKISEDKNWRNTLIDSFSQAFEQEIMKHLVVGDSMGINEEIESIEEEKRKNNLKKFKQEVEF